MKRILFLTPALLLIGACAGKTSWHETSFHKIVMDTASSCHNEATFSTPFCQYLIEKNFGREAYEKDKAEIKGILGKCYEGYIAERLFGKESPVTQGKILNCQLALYNYVDNKVIKEDNK